MLDWAVWDNRKRTEMSQKLGALGKIPDSLNVGGDECTCSIHSREMFVRLQQDCTSETPPRQHWEISLKKRFCVGSRSQHSTCGCVVGFWAEVLLLPLPWSCWGSSDRHGVSGSSQATPSVALHRITAEPLHPPSDKPVISSFSDFALVCVWSEMVFQCFFVNTVSVV